MSLSRFSRLVQLGRTGRSPTALQISESSMQAERQRPQRHPAMTGLNVSPVHGRHCICGRCERTRGP